LKVSVIASKPLGLATVAANATWDGRDLSAVLEQVGIRRSGGFIFFMEK
jgi:hypothetical protein